MSEDSKAEFQSYLFFLRHFCQLIRANRHPSYGPQLLTALVQHQNQLIAAVQPGQFNPQELQIIRKYLFTSWNSECVARLSSLFDINVRRFTNQWKPVQCYYATYFLLVCVQFGATRKIPKSHEPTINYATNSLIHWLPIPWRMRIRYDDKALVDFPAGTLMHGPSGWNLSNNEPNFHTANFLRITGLRKQQETGRELRRRKVKIHGHLYRIKDVKVGFVSCFDVMWRFRRWANYHEGDTIIEGGEFEDHAEEFDACFNIIVDATAVLCESVLCRQIGHASLRGFYDEFVGLTDGRLDASVIARRRDIVCPV